MLAARRAVPLWVLLLCVPMAHSTEAAAGGHSVPIGGTLRTATLRGLNGPSRRLSVYRGRPLIINVWASWCGPCRQEMASLERLAWLEQAQHFAIIGISTDDDPDRATQFLHETRSTISHFLDSGLQMESMLGASRLPLTVLIDAKGRIVDKIYGAQQWDGAEALQRIAHAFDQQSRR